jgi:peroxiredoxin
MAALAEGVAAPEFDLPTMDDKRFSLRDALTRGPVIAAFFKISCPVCQYAMPFLERIYQAYGSRSITIVGISQNEKRDTTAFLKQFGVTFPVLLEDTGTFDVSNAYGLTHVPSIFWISSDGTIEVSSVGWSRQDFDEINRKAGEAAGSSHPVFKHDEQVVEFRGG